MPRQTAGSKFGDRIAQLPDGRWVFRCQRRHQGSEEYVRIRRRHSEAIADRQAHDARTHRRNLEEDGLKLGGAGLLSEGELAQIAELFVSRDEIADMISREVTAFIGGPKWYKTQVYDLKSVAAHEGISPRYLGDCIRAKRDEDFRCRRGIPLSTLETLPLEGWFRRGNKVLIRETDLMAQLGVGQTRSEGRGHGKW